MAMDKRVRRWAEALDEARRTVRPVDLNAELSRLDGPTAYAVQRASAARRGGAVVGYKLGFADPAVRQATGVPEPVFGRFLAEDLVPEGGAVRRDAFLRPALEGELVVVVESALPEVGGLTAGHVRERCRLTVGFDLSDSRLVGGAAGWSAAAADNCGAGRVVVGTTRVALPKEGEAAQIRVQLRRNGRLAAEGAGERIGDPAAAVVWLARKLAGEGAALLPGQFVLLGAVAGPVPLGEGETWEVEAPGVGLTRMEVAGGNRQRDP